LSAKLLSMLAQFILLFLIPIAALFTSVAQAGDRRPLIEAHRFLTPAFKARKPAQQSDKQKAAAKAAFEKNFDLLVDVQLNTEKLCQAALKLADGQNPSAFDKFHDALQDEYKNAKLRGGDDNMVSNVFGALKKLGLDQDAKIVQLKKDLNADVFAELKGVLKRPDFVQSYNQLKLDRQATLRAALTSPAKAKNTDELLQRYEAFVKAELNSVAALHDKPATQKQALRKVALVLFTVGNKNDLDDDESLIKSEFADLLKDQDFARLGKIGFDHRQALAGVTALSRDHTTTMFYLAVSSAIVEQASVELKGTISEAARGYLIKAAEPNR
jgi:hypothetical protein